MRASLEIVPEMVGRLWAGFGRRGCSGERRGAAAATSFEPLLSPLRQPKPVRHTVLVSAAPDRLALYLASVCRPLRHAVRPRNIPRRLFAVSRLAQFRKQVWDAGLDDFPYHVIFHAVVSVDDAVARAEYVATVLLDKPNQKHVPEPVQTASRSPRGVQIWSRQGEIPPTQHSRARHDVLGNPRHGRATRLRRLISNPRIDMAES